jgi:alpha-amylase
MNWDAIKSNPDTKTTLAHWRNWVNSEKTTPAIGAGYINK